ncbi:hypothetical protein [Mesorhizobium sp. STM 4661]|nr:hypothetical protein [Mesorhizobium sp. STM 4661]
MREVVLSFVAQSWFYLGAEVTFLPPGNPSHIGLRARQGRAHFV